MSASNQSGAVSLRVSGADARSPSLSIREAARSDVEELVALVNAAYRPAAGRGGWTHEADLVEGSRIDRAQLTELFTDRDSVILVGCFDQRLAACVQVRKTGASSQIGMLAVHPKSQGRGLGSEMLKRAEEHARTRFGSEAAEMTVITRRAELMSYYRARGYQATGETADYPLSAGVGAPKCADLMLSKLVKRLAF